MWRRVDLVSTDVSKERIASIFRIEKLTRTQREQVAADPEDGGDTFLRNVGSHKIYTAPHPKRRHSSVTTVKTSNLTIPLLSFAGRCLVTATV
jgi:hypothetical protein